MIMLASVPVLLVCCLIAAGESRRKDEEQTPEIHLDSSRDLTPRFFAGTPSRLDRGTELPVELMLSQIERHVRLEQAAAEIYLLGPNRDRVHSGAHSQTLN